MERLAKNARRVALAVFIGCLITAIPSIFQHQFKAGSFADGLCEIALLPGELCAVPFKDRGDLSPEFLWRSRIANTVIYGAVAYWIFRRRRLRT
jgi:hypothetical protein